MCSGACPTLLPCYFLAHLSAPGWLCPCFSPGSPHTGTPPRDRAHRALSLKQWKHSSRSEVGGLVLLYYNYNSFKEIGEAVSVSFCRQIFDSCFSWTFFTHLLTAEITPGCIAKHNQLGLPCLQSGGWWMPDLITWVSQTERSASGGCYRVSEPTLHHCLWASTERGNADTSLSHGLTHSFQTWVRERKKKLLSTLHSSSRRSRTPSLASIKSMHGWLS